jgi:hypothetical protein
MELESFEKPYCTLLNSSNGATGGPIYMLVTKPRNLHYRYCPLQYWYGNLSLSFLVM